MASWPFNGYLSRSHSSRRARANKIDRKNKNVMIIYLIRLEGASLIKGKKICPTQMIHFSQ